MLVRTNLSRSSRTSSGGQEVSMPRATQALFKSLRGELPVNQRRYCDADDAPRPATGFIAYGRYQLCNSCAVEYEAARTSAVVTSPGQYVRGRRFGEIFDGETS
jgi:hypothetical protein